MQIHGCFSRAKPSWVDIEGKDEEEEEEEEEERRKKKKEESFPRLSTEARVVISCVR